MDCSGSLHRLVALVLSDGGVGQRWFQEEERVGVVALDGGAKAAEMGGDEAAQEVAELRRLRLVGGGVVVDGFGAADGVDADDEGLEVRVLVLDSVDQT